MATQNALVEHSKANVRVAKYRINKSTKVNVRHNTIIIRHSIYPKHQYVNDRDTAEDISGCKTLKNTICTFSPKKEMGLGEKIVSHYF